MTTSARYEWAVRPIGDLGKPTRQGEIQAENIRQAKIRVTKASATGNWKKSWRKDGEVHLKTDGDGRSVGPFVLKPATLLLWFREVK